MAQLWGGRFTKETDQLVYAFNASINFDKRLINEDIEGSIAHVTMLAKQGILTDSEKDEEGKQTMRTLARNMTFLMKSIALGKEKYGLPEKEQKAWTNFVR